MVVMLEFLLVLFASVQRDGAERLSARRRFHRRDEGFTHVGGCWVSGVSSSRTSMRRLRTGDGLD